MEYLGHLNATHSCYTVLKREHSRVVIDIHIYSTLLVIHQSFINARQYKCIRLC